MFLNCILELCLSTVLFKCISQLLYYSNVFLRIIPANRLFHVSKSVFHNFTFQPCLSTVFLNCIYQLYFSINVLLNCISPHNPRSPHFPILGHLYFITVSLNCMFKLCFSTIILSCIVQLYFSNVFLNECITQLYFLK